MKQRHRRKPALKRIKRYFLQVGISLDQFINATFLAGWGDETLSSHTHRKQEVQPYRTLRKILNKLFFWQEDHCREAYESEIERKHLPPSMRS